ncbi:MAG: FAD:protein FMN transferase [Polaribacter sp.]
MIKIKNIFFFLAILIGFTFCKNEEKPNRIILNGHIFGTTYKIVYTHSSINYKKSIDSLFYLVNKSLSTYMPTSDISKINAGDSTIVVDDLFLEVFKKSKKIYTETNGFFDPTVGNLVNAWGFGPKNEKKNLTITEVKQQMQFVGFDKVKIVGRKVIKEHPKIYLDFNAIAKGYGIDVIGRFLESKNIVNYLIEIGGEIRAKGKKENGNPWKVGFDNPNTDGSRTVSRTINLFNTSMATSGNYRKFRITEDGKKYVHTVNPKTGFAKESNLLSVSVISDSDCADVDAYATAFMAMGLERTKEFIQSHKKIYVVLLFTNANGEIEEYNNL